MEYTEGLSSPSPFQQSCSPSPLLSIYTICIVIFSLQRQQRHPFITMLILSIGDRLVTCMVRAKQRNHLMFTAAASLIDKHSSIREKVLEHSRANPYISVPQNPAVITGEGAGNGLFESRVVDSGIVKDLVRSSGKRYRRFVRSRGTISNSGGFNEPLLALTYLTDTYLIKAPCDESTIYHLALLHHLQIRKSQTKRPKNSK